MALPDLTGADKFIDDLNPVWPDGVTEYVRDGDDWIRGIQNVLQNSFPAITGAMTRSHTSLNTGSVPIGAKMVFYQAAAPTGWTREWVGTTTYGLRVVATASAGGGYGGTDDPILNDKVPSHTHPVAAVNTSTESDNHTHSGTTGIESADHAHSGVTGDDFPDHTHLQGTAGGAAAGVGSFSLRGGQDDATTGATSRHTHPFTTGGRSAAHAHSFTTGVVSAPHLHLVPAHDTSANGSAATWAPRYLDVIVCERTS